MKKLDSDRYRSGEKALSRDEYDKLVSVISNPEDLLMLKLAVATGWRREDLAETRLSWIDLDNGEIQFHEAKKDRKDKQMIRRIHISQKTVTAMKLYLNSLSREQRKILEKKDRLFKFTGRTAYNRLNYWCRAAGIPERPFHALRATCIKFCHAAGWSDSEIAALTGDKISTIQEHYMTPSVSEMKTVTNDKEIL